MTMVLTKGTSAHVLKTDGSIGAVLHIDPELECSLGKVD